MGSFCKLLKIEKTISYVFKPGAPAEGWRMPGFLKLLLSVM